MASRENARRFHFLREIASGGFGTVFLCKVAHADGFSRLAAVKLLKAQWTDSDEVVRRIRDEARLLGLLRHRNIITVSDLTSIDGRTAVVMEFVEGVDLRTIVHHLAERGQAFPARAAMEITAAAAGALDAAYNRPPMPGEKPLRVIHRDIKPSNVMIDTQGEVKVLDFGVARSDLAGRESHTAELQFGSVDYMAPERLFFEPETPAGDIYALGATLFELLALEKLGKAKGRPEQHASTIEDRLSYMRACMPVRGAVATELTDLVRACVAFEHEQRPTAAEIHQRCRALSRLLDSEELQPWAERVVPPLVLEAASTPAHAGGMTDSVRTEDSISRGFTDDVAPPQAQALGARVRQGALRELEDSTGRQVPNQPMPAPLAASLPRPALRPTPTLAPVEDPGDILTAVAGQAAEPQLEQVLAEEDPADEWTEGPTYVGPMPSPTGSPVPAAIAQGNGAPAVQAAPSGVPPRPRSLGSTPDDPALVGLPGRSGLDDGPVMIAPATGAPGARASSDPTAAPGLVAVGGDIGPGYEAEPTAIGLEERTSSLEPPLSQSAASQSAASQSPAAAAPSKIGRRVAVVLGGLVGGCLLMVVSGVVLGAGMWWFARSGDGLPSLMGEPLDDAVAELDGVDSVDRVAELDGVDSVDSEPPGAALVFESLAPDTRKLNVSCTGGDGKGSTRAEVGLASADRCMVTAIMSDRSRLVAVVTEAEAGAYRCFVEGEETCLRQ